MSFSRCLKYWTLSWFGLKVSNDASDQFDPVVRARTKLLQKGKGMMEISVGTQDLRGRRSRHKPCGLVVYSSPNMYDVVWVYTCPGLRIVLGKCGCQGNNISLNQKILLRHARTSMLTSHSQFLEKEVSFEVGIFHFFSNEVKHYSYPNPTLLTLSGWWLASITKAQNLQ